MKRMTTAIENDPAAFRTRVRMAAVQVAGLTPAELSAALAYEVEPFSGIPAADAEIAFVPAVDPDPAVRLFEVTVRRRPKAGIGGSAGRWLRTATVFALAVFAAIGFDWYFVSREVRSLAAEASFRQRLDNELKALRGRTRDLRGQAEKIRAERERGLAAQAECAAAREFHLGLFSALGSAFGSRAVLKSFDSDGKPYTLRFTAVAVNALAAGEVMAALGNFAAGKNLSFAPGPIRAVEHAVTVEFEGTLWK